MKADCLDFKTDSLVLFLQKKAFLIKKSALLTQYVVKTFKFSPYMIKKNLQSDGRELLQVYRITKKFPSDERFGLTVQLRRAAASVPTNISEGCGRDSERELARFMSIAAGSASEVEYQMLLACDLNYIQDETHRELNQQVNEVKRMLNSFIQKLTANG